MISCDLVRDTSSNLDYPTKIRVGPGNINLDPITKFGARAVGGNLDYLTKFGVEDSKGQS